MDVVKTAEEIVAGLDTPLASEGDLLALIEKVVFAPIGDQAKILACVMDEVEARMDAAAFKAAS